MKRYIVPVIIISGIFLITISCGKKGSFPSTPDLKFQSIYQTDSNSIVINCTFRDREGDIQDSIYFQVYNLTTPGNSTGLFAPYSVPDFPAQQNMEGNIMLILTPTDVHIGSGLGGGADSVYFDLYLKDRAGHISDTVRTDTILVQGT